MWCTMGGLRKFPLITAGEAQIHTSMIRRLNEAVVWIPHMTFISNGQEYYYQLLLSHVPFRQESRWCEGLTPEAAFKKKSGDLKGLLKKSTRGVYLERALVEIDELNTIYAVGVLPSYDMLNDDE